MDFSNFLTEPNGFRTAVEYFADSTNAFSKEDLHSAFLVITKLYLDELISAKMVENLLVERYGEKVTDEFFEAVVRQNEAITEDDTDRLFETDPKAAIVMQFDLIDGLAEGDLSGGDGREF